MAIVLHRSNRTEALVEELCGVLRESLPSDPLVQYPVVVGSRGMERWLRYEIATRLDIAAGLDFPFPRQALAGAGRWLLDGTPEGDAAFWQVDPADEDEAWRWEREALTFRLVGLLRGRLDQADFASVARYLAEGRAEGGVSAVTARELLFAAEVGEVLDRLMHERPEQALAWAEDPDTAEAEHRWLAVLLADIGAASDPRAPAVLHRDLTTSRPRATGRFPWGQK